ncbi:transcriptional protein SWT1 [Tenrec ecaudatus]|uniref:transcriptional protein SWT1 n=1 Tax=Tenrec ecaudatus TaxID=94439 RepID=UPI003F5ABDD4
MFNKESCGKKEKSRRKATSSSPNVDKEDKNEENTSGSASSTSSVRSVSSEKRKLKPDQTGILYSDPKRRQELKRFSVISDILRKRSRTSLSQGPVQLQETSCSNDNQIISQNPTSNGTRANISKCINFKLKNTKFTNVQDKLELKNLGSPKIAKDVTATVKSQMTEKKWAPLLSQELKTEGCREFRDSSESCVLEKDKKKEFSQDSNSNKVLEPRRRKISFKIPIKSRATLQKLVEENVFSIVADKSKTNQKEENPESSEVPPYLTRHKIEDLLSDNTDKPSPDWKGKYHQHQEPNDSRASENLPQSVDAPCSSASPESIQDTDQEMQIVEELHAARVGKSVDLPVIPPSGELMSMEIDLVEDDVHSSAENTASNKSLLIVIDTNILMNHLKFVRMLKTTEIPGFDRLVLVIPWVVVQELDRMKAGKLLKHAQHKAVPAVHFINDSLKSPDRKLWGQSIQLASQKFYGLSDENNDDRVLKCCLQYQELFPCSQVILCTDDRNLRNKGIISGVKSLSKEELNSELLSLFMVTDGCHQPCISKQQLKATPVKKSSEEEPTGSGLSVVLGSIIAELEKSLGMALSSILETEMKIAFGNLWMEMLYLKPPWTLVHLFQCFKKHWLAVFGLIMENNLLLIVESLYENLCKADSTLDFATVKFLLQDSKTLLHAFSTRSNYDGILPQAFAQVDKLLQIIPEVKAKLKPKPSESTLSQQQEATSMKPGNPETTLFSDSQLPQSNRNQEIWSILENVWITIYQNSTDVFQRLGSNSALTTSNIASFEEAFICLQKLMAAVKDILEGIQRILAPSSTHQDVEMLYNFLIKTELNQSVIFTARELYDCVSQNEYREKLTIGCRQLVELEYTMQQCHASVFMKAQNQGWCEERSAQL